MDEFVQLQKVLLFKATYPKLDKKPIQTRAVRNGDFFDTIFI